jgi:hypothetical protein
MPVVRRFRESRLMHRIGAEQRLADDPAAVTDLHVLGIKPQIRIGTIQRASAEHLHLLIQATAVAETRSLVMPSTPSCSTRRLTFRVETPLT